MSEVSEAYFFGVGAGESSGHYLRDINGRVYTWWPFGAWPYYIGETPIDRGFTPTDRGQSVAKLTTLTDAAGTVWTVLGMNDYSADTRPGCNANFIAKGQHDFERMLFVAEALFSSIFIRINSAAPIRLEADQ